MAATAVGVPLPGSTATGVVASLQAAEAGLQFIGTRAAIIWGEETSSFRDVLSVLVEGAEDLGLGSRGSCPLGRWVRSGHDVRGRRWRDDLPEEIQEHRSSE
ncbi:hypothetical protein QR680_014240 [Steinernema hermaphroditum]|uniref:Uncharacterized protein n=1 Tax=Steinernema hermaphroditum TaxID=289476 RepID=A0AA39M3W4_9BILA|nr:hypothetical protein QR680_014240 [Steinernema hermaphroditum]